MSTADHAAGIGHRRLGQAADEGATGLPSGARLLGLLADDPDVATFEARVARAFGADASRPVWDQLDAVQRALLLRTITRQRAHAPVKLLGSVSSVADVLGWARRAERGEASDRRADPGPLAPTRDGSEAVAIGGGLVHLRGWRQDDLPALYHAATSPGQGRRWRFRGATPSFREFASEFGHGTLATLVVASNDDDRVVGSVAAYSASLENGWTYIGFQGVADRSGVGLMLEGMFCFVTWLFDTWDLRKVYAELDPGLHDRLVSLGAGPLRVEGRLERHTYQQGAWQDVLLTAIWRDEWATFVASVGDLVGLRQPS